MIKKFDNGNIKLNITKDLKDGYYNSDNIGNFYYDEMVRNDLYFDYIDGNSYFIDTNRNIVYKCPYYLFSSFIDYMLEYGKIKLYPYDKETSYELISKYLEENEEE